MQSKSEKKETALDSAIKASDAAFQTGDYSKSLEQLQGAVDEAQTKEDKILVYTNLAAAAASAGDMAKAIDYLEQKHKVAPETEGQDAYLLGSYYERIEDNAKAIDQYKKAIEYMKTQGNDQSNQNQIYSLEVRIESLGG
jgi:tetratricopeptide (TPR) repeat protein